MLMEKLSHYASGGERGIGSRGRNAHAEQITSGWPLAKMIEFSRHGCCSAVEWMRELPRVITLRPRGLGQASNLVLCLQNRTHPGSDRMAWHPLSAVRQR